MSEHYHTLRLILGDQLNAQHSWFTHKDDSILYVIAELHQEASYTKHHIQKLCAFFLAMENFSRALKQAGHHVLHLTLDDTQGYDLPSLIDELCQRYSVTCFHYQRPDEFRLHNQMSALQLDVHMQCYDTEHFLLPFHELQDYIQPKKHNRMEVFYRKMRKRFNILMEGHDPEGGQWNYDSENRQKIKTEHMDQIPEPKLFRNNVSQYLERIAHHNIVHFGECDKTIIWPANRQQAQQLLVYFCEYCLPNFGRFQDAMVAQHSKAWSLYHSRLSFAINTKMLHPMHVINTAINAYRQAQSDIDLAQIEGFVRQILGWREYIRAVYWLNMPDYSQLNALQAEQSLPDYFWTGDTKMACLKHAIKQSLKHAYAHHIQRLMITGNFCLLSGIHPDEVDEWYLGIYIDAIEWVEMPNTRGMSQFADNGLVATKPYVAGGNYVKKMSNYCADCHYNVNKKMGETSCPLNSLYWHFMVRYRERFSQNPRIGMIYRNWDKQDESQRIAVIKRADWCLNNINAL